MRFLDERRERLTVSHVRSRGHVHMGEIRRSSLTRYFRMIPGFCSIRLTGECATSPLTLWGEPAKPCR